MKVIIIFLMSALIFACNANKSATSDLNSDKLTSVCPDNGTCTFEVLKNKNFNMKKDKFGNSYSELVDGNKTVLKFEYEKHTKKELQDDNYSEIIYIQIDNNLESIELKDQALSNVSAGFSRICYCKGQTGTYPIKSGNMNITKFKNNRYNLSFSFTISEVPQIITSINETFEL